MKFLLLYAGIIFISEGYAETSSSNEVNYTNCEPIGQGSIVRYNKGLKLYNTFNAGDRDVYMNNKNIFYTNPEFLESSTTKFAWTKELKDNGYKVPKNTSMRIFATGDIDYKVVKHPNKRTNATKSSYDFKITYETIYDYSNNYKKKNSTADDISTISCKYYSVSWCGDGIVDKEYEECDPKAKGYNESSCDIKTCKEL